eukprot:TRINITY_DN23502_c0_g1_i1.p1 TRINITY_DN23502_c0_g1~~TRINITY_DN23502_c0_g1_i1.p1  ORF type:complete len:1389 (+),score=187.60 TRINITY_DN23502_c0_g1_i1:223-4389(+)
MKRMPGSADDAYWHGSVMFTRRNYSEARKKILRNETLHESAGCKSLLPAPRNSSSQAIPARHKPVSASQKFVCAARAFRSAIHESILLTTTVKMVADVEKNMLSAEDRWALLLTAESTMISEDMRGLYKEINEDWKETYAGLLQKLDETKIQTTRSKIVEAQGTLLNQTSNLLKCMARLQESIDPTVLARNYEEVSRMAEHVRSLQTSLHDEKRTAAGLQTKVGEVEQACDRLNTVIMRLAGPCSNAQHRQSEAYEHATLSSPPLSARRSIKEVGRTGAKGARNQLCLPRSTLRTSETIQFGCKRTVGFEQDLDRIGTQDESEDVDNDRRKTVTLMLKESDESRDSKTDEGTCNEHRSPRWSRKSVKQEPHILKADKQLLPRLTITSLTSPKLDSAECDESSPFKIETSTPPKVAGMESDESDSTRVLLPARPDPRSPRVGRLPSTIMNHMPDMLDPRSDETDVWTRGEVKEQILEPDLPLTHATPRRKPPALLKTSRRSVPVASVELDRSTLDRKVVPSALDRKVAPEGGFRKSRSTFSQVPSALDRKVAPEGGFRKSRSTFSQASTTQSQILTQSDSLFAGQSQDSNDWSQESTSGVAEGQDRLQSLAMGHVSAGKVWESLCAVVSPEALTGVGREATKREDANYAVLGSSASAAQCNELKSQYFEERISDHESGTHQVAEHVQEHLASLKQVYPEAPADSTAERTMMEADAAMPHQFDTSGMVTHCTAMSLGDAAGFAGQPATTAVLAHSSHHFYPRDEKTVKAWRRPIHFVATLSDAIRNHLGRAPRPEDNLRTRNGDEMTFEQLEQLSEESLQAVFPIQLQHPGLHHRLDHKAATLRNELLQAGGSGREPQVDALEENIAHFEQGSLQQPARFEAERPRGFAGRSRARGAGQVASLAARPEDDNLRTRNGDEMTFEQLEQLSEESLQAVFPIQFQHPGLHCLDHKAATFRNELLRADGHGREPQVDTLEEDVADFGRGSLQQPARFQAEGPRGFAGGSRARGAGQVASLLASIASPMGSQTYSPRRSRLTGADVHHKERKRNTFSPRSDDRELAELASTEDRQEEMWSKPLHYAGNFADTIEFQLGRPPLPEDTLRTQNGVEISFAELSEFTLEELQAASPIQVQETTADLKSMSHLSGHQTFWSEPVRYASNYASNIQFCLGRPPLPQDKLRTQHGVEITFAELSEFTVEELQAAFPIQVQETTPDWTNYTDPSVLQSTLSKLVHYAENYARPIAFRLGRPPLPGDMLRTRQGEHVTFSELQSLTPDALPAIFPILVRPCTHEFLWLDKALDKRALQRNLDTRTTIEKVLSERKRCGIRESCVSSDLAAAWNKYSDLIGPQKCTCCCCSDCLNLAEPRRASPLAAAIRRAACLPVTADHYGL